MKIPAVRGIIDRRILVNYRVHSEALRTVLPAPFEPKIVQDHGMGGICLIRLKHIRPKVIPFSVGISSENAAHRIAVEWTDGGTRREGVYIPRRDTSSWLNTLAGGRLFPGTHHHASFDVSEEDDRYAVSMKADDGSTHLHAVGRVTDRLPSSSIFDSVGAASSFFERGSVGYSAAPESGHFDGLELRCLNWDVEPLDVEDVSSSFFDDPELFPPGTATFDCALLMRGIDHEWHSKPPLCHGAEVRNVA